jgi:hypothetical protein
MFIRKILLSLILTISFLLVSCINPAEDTDVVSEPTTEVLDIQDVETSEDDEHGFEISKNDEQDFEVSASYSKRLEFEIFELHKKFYNDFGDFAELDLRLPRLEGDFDGIPKINDFFLSKEEYFYYEVGIEEILEMFDEMRNEYAGEKPDSGEIRGLERNWGRVAHYEVEVVIEDIISVSAWLWGGQGGVSWLGMEGNTFNLNTGERLGLSDIFNVSEEVYLNLIYDFVSREIDDNIKAHQEPFSLYWFDDAYSEEGYKIIRQFDPDDFFLTEKSLVVFYPKYAFAYGAAGLSLNIFDIPYDDIIDFLSFDLVQ